MDGLGNGVGWMWVWRLFIKIGGFIYYVSIYGVCIVYWMESSLFCFLCSGGRIFMIFFDFVLIGMMIYWVV